MNCFCILLACFLNLLTPLQQRATPQTCSQECKGHRLARIYQLSTIRTSHQTAQLRCSARGSCSRRCGWNGIRLSPGETEGNDRDATGLNGGADCDPWVSQSRSTWAGRSSWNTTNRATQNGLKMRASPFTADIACVYRRFARVLQFTKYGRNVGNLYPVNEPCC